MKYIVTTFFTFIFCLILTASISLHAETPQNEIIITIFIHGTNAPIPKEVYKHVRYYFTPGLQHVNNQCLKHGPYDIIQGLKDSGYIDMHHCYMLGWSGKLSSKERKRAAQQELLPRIIDLIASYVKQYKILPKIRIITHSHGGNLALYFIHALDKKNVPLHIEELIMFAPPVQEWTKDYIESTHCKKIYHFFSVGDIIQRIDPQGIQTRINKQSKSKKTSLFSISDRTFAPNKKLVQIKTYINDLPATHLDFIDFLYAPILRNFLRRHFTRFLPALGMIMKKVKPLEGGTPITMHMKYKDEQYSVEIIN